MTPEQARRILGVEEAASAEQIRRAYRRRARSDHPDAGGDPEAFVLLQTALATLTGPPTPRPRATSSPSTSNHRRPSTTGPMATGWGQAARDEWHEEVVDVSEVDWHLPPTSPPHAWSREELARRLADSGRTARGLSRKPGSSMNRMAAWLSDDLFCEWVVRPGETLGRPGHDLEIVMRFPSGPGRKVADRSDFTLGWVAERRPSTTVVFRVMHPSRDPRQTALRVANALAGELESIGWPLGDWWNVRAV